MTWDYSLTAAAEKDLDRLDRHTVSAVFDALDRLVLWLTDPESVTIDAKRLKGFKPPRYRVRVADYRAVYLMDKAASMVTVIRVRHRKEVYER